VPPTRSIGHFEGQCDVGHPKIAGSATYDAGRGVYLVSSAGLNMWDVRDEFHFMWTRTTGDFLLHARVEFLGPNREPHRKAGCIVRAGLDHDAPYADACLHGDGLTSLQFRRRAGGISEQLVATPGADVVELERNGQTYTMRSAKSGAPFVTTTLAGVTLEGDLYVGLFLCSHNVDIVERAAFHDVQFEFARV
jgi:hypothetical protein